VILIGADMLTSANLVQSTPNHANASLGIPRVRRSSRAYNFGRTPPLIAEGHTYGGSRALACKNSCIYHQPENRAFVSFCMGGNGAVLVGYMRVSTVEQNLDLQRDALEGAGCERLYEDTCSGAVVDRPGLAKALDQLRGGDDLVVWKLDRIGRSLGVTP